MSGLSILASGMSGPIGADLLPALAADGHRVRRLVRRAPSDSGEVQWDPGQPLSPEKVSGFDAVIHLAGETIVGRWTAAKKARIRDSRVLGTRHLVDALRQSGAKPGVLITASAIGYYGNRGHEALNESSAPGNNFLAGVCREWEAAAHAAEAAGIRVVSLRIGMMLSPVGGALKQMLLPFRIGAGGRIGSGQQYWSWVSIRDVVGAIQHAISNPSLRGAVNAVSPQPVTNAEFTRTLASALHRPAIFPMPAFAVKTIFGQMGDELLLASTRVLPGKLQASGYRFRHPELGGALRELLASS
jgi:uncharacterized protein (TIGR01777 family)